MYSIRLKHGRRTDERVAAMEFLTEAKVPRVAQLLQVKVLEDEVELRMSHCGTSLDKIQFCCHVDRAYLVEALLKHGLSILGGVHRHGVLHLDIHAGNFCVGKTPACCGDVERCTRSTLASLETMSLIDFGSAVFCKKGVWRGRTRGGAWWLMPLEQFGDKDKVVELSPWTDTFSLASMVASYGAGYVDREATRLCPVRVFPRHPGLWGAEAFKQSPQRRREYVLCLISKMGLRDDVARLLRVHFRLERA